MNAWLVFVFALALNGLSVRSSAQTPDDPINADTNPEASKRRALVAATVKAEREVLRGLSAKEQHEIDSVNKDKSSEDIKRTKFKAIRRKYSEMRKATLLRSRLDLRAKLDADKNE